MKFIKSLLPVGAVLLMGGGLLTTSCNDEWDDHYDASSLLTTQNVTVYKGDAVQYLRSQGNLSQLTALLENRGLLTEIAGKQACTVIVCENEQMGAETSADTAFANNCVSDVAVSPASLVDGYGIYMKSGKNVWVSRSGDAVKFDHYNLTKAVKTDNGYIYYVDGVIPVRPSISEYIQGLGSDYSLFKEYVALFEETYFDASSSTPAGVDAMGNTYYKDSVISTRNTLMDRYTTDGLELWNMRSENFKSTLFIPNNDLLSHAYLSALDSIPVWLNRSATAADSLKFKKWIVSSCFVDRRLTPQEVSATAENFDCVGGCVQEIEKALDRRTYTEYAAAHWNPSIQRVDVDNTVELSNGNVYYLTDYKIPNHIIIYRVKARLSNVWAALTPAQQGWTGIEATEGGYFRWNHWIEPLGGVEGQGPMSELDPTWPTIYYNLLTAIPDTVAIADSLPCSVEYDGLLLNDAEKSFGLSEVHLPAGEYYLRMGFKHSLTYSISIYFAGADEEFGEPLVKDMSLVATGSNFHFDRGGAMEGLDFYGSESVGYPEYYDWRFWYNQDPVLYVKASAYDTDGYQVATVKLNKSGNFKIKIESIDNAYLYDVNNANPRSKNNVTQLMMYHWCLRPTANNY